VAGTCDPSQSWSLWPYWQHARRCAFAKLPRRAPARTRAKQQWHPARIGRSHISVSDGRDGGSGDLTWQQRGESYSFTVRAPVTGKTWKLSGDARQARLEGVDEQPIRGAEPERLLRERLGWDVPLAALGSWVRGLRAPGRRADVQYDAQNLPAVVVQDGWKIEYRDWFADSQPPMPRRLFAARGNARVRMAIEHWSFDD
jgi:outer membrane lipoprotein LolB